MATIPVIHLDDSPLSDDLRLFLSEVAEETGRIIFFVDLTKVAAVDPTVDASVKARAISEPDHPYLAIALNFHDMSRSQYKQSVHDPLIAHEAGHLLMWSRGYSAISKVEQDPGNLAWINMVNNWLSDPLINEFIFDRGFDISKDRAKEIRSSIKPLNKGIWAQKPYAGSLQLGVSLLLEPNINHSLRSQFRSALRRGLGSEGYGPIDAIVKMIRSKNIHSPEVFRSTSLDVLASLDRQFGFKIADPKHDEPFARFRPQEIEEWKQREIMVTESWP